MIDYIEKAKAFAMMAHKGQTDKAGKDYFTAHVAVVADGVEPDPLVKAAAYLHDTVEDTGTVLKVTDEPLMYAPGKSNIHAL